MAKKVIVFGAYGQRNLGDEALLDVLTTYLKKNKIKMSCNSSDPVETSKLFKIDSFHTSLKKDFFKKIKYFIGADRIIYGGGSLLLELKMVSSNKKLPLYRVFIINTIAKMLGKKIVFLGIGAEKVSKGIAEILLKKSVNLSDICYVRDSKSYKVLKDYNLKKVRKGEDIALLFDNLKEKRRKGNKIKRICILPFCRISENTKTQTNYFHALAKYALLMDKRGYEIEFYPLSQFSKDPMNDLQAIKQIKSYISEQPNIKFHTNYMIPTEFNKWISKFDLVISSRYHGLIFSLLNNIPFINLSSAQKNLGLLEDIDLKTFSLNPEKISKDSLLKLTSQIQNNYLKLKNKISKNNVKMQKTADDMLKNIMEEVRNEK